jgi:hypothetical protein
LESQSPTPLPSLLQPAATPEPEIKTETTLGGATSQEEKENAARKKWAAKKKLDLDNLSDANEAKFNVY